MDVFASALANVCSATILIYYPCGKDVNTHTIVSEKGKILTYVEVSFVSGHYDLIVDRLNMKEKGPTKETPPEVILIDDSPVKQKPDGKRHDLKCEIKKEQTFSNQNFNESTIMEIRIEDRECSLSDSEELVNHEEAENSVNISVTSSDENLESPESTTTVTYRGKRKYIAPYIFEDVVPVKTKALPQDINDISTYTVPLSKDRTLKNCKWRRNHRVIFRAVD